jgi:hypothetical protein
VLAELQWAYMEFGRALFAPPDRPKFHQPGHPAHERKPSRPGPKPRPPR